MQSIPHPDEYRCRTGGRSLFIISRHGRCYKLASWKEGNFQVAAPYPIDYQKAFSSSCRTVEILVSRRKCSCHLKPTGQGHTLTFPHFTIDIVCVCMRACACVCMRVSVLCACVCVCVRVCTASTSNWSTTDPGGLRRCGVFVIIVMIFQFLR